MNTLAKGFSNDFVFPISCLTRKKKEKKNGHGYVHSHILCLVLLAFCSLAGIFPSYYSCNLSPAVRPKISCNVNKQKITGGIYFVFVAK